MKIKRFKLDEMFNEIKEIINYYEISQYQYKRNRIFLSNDDKLNFSIPKDSIAHLLGININYLISTRLFSSTDSFNLLNELCNNSYRIYNAHMEGIISFDKLFSPFIFKKIEGFKNNIKLNIEETELVCKYDSSKAYLFDDNTEKYDYIIVKKYSDGKIGVLGLVYNANHYSFVPMSNQLYDTFDEAKENLNKYLRNQEVSIITGINHFNIYTEQEKYVSLFLSNKPEKIDNIKFYKELFNCCLDVSGDYNYVLCKLLKNRDDHFEDNDLIDIIVNNIRQGKLIDTKIFRDTSLSKIIDAINDNLCENKISTDSSISETYSNMKNSLQTLREEVAKLKQDNTELTNTNKLLSDKVEELTEENMEYKNTEQEIIKILNKKPRM